MLKAEWRRGGGEVGDKGVDNGDGDARYGGSSNSSNSSNSRNVVIKRIKQKTWKEDEARIPPPGTTANTKATIVAVFIDTFYRAMVYKVEATEAAKMTHTVALSQASADSSDMTATAT
jgi:hypothetical protein